MSKILVCSHVISNPFKSVCKPRLKIKFVLRKDPKHFWCLCNFNLYKNMFLDVIPESVRNIKDSNQVMHSSKSSINISMEKLSDEPTTFTFMGN